MRPTSFISHPEYLKHETGRRHPEEPARLTAILRHIETTGMFANLVRAEPSEPSLDWLTLAHTPEYVRAIEAACRGGVRALDPDTCISSDSYRAALLAVGGALLAVDLVMQGNAANAFVALRPPGHHAERERAMGFCLFNNIAIAARYAQKRYGLKRILIVDWDVHHGNGTQHTFEDDPSVLFFSTHQFPFYPGTGRTSERGTGAGLGYTVNVPLAAGCGDHEYREVFEKVLYPAAQAFEPHLLLVSAGFDAHRDDPMAGMNVTEDGYAQMTAIVRDIAERYCEGRLVSLLEGGYNLEALARSVERHLHTLGQP
ncbi:MAG TPA: histone deacetylase [Candidatus Tectomicrobia bacterium]|nr:histone deacetylase [Candidatus Tectomicrobia bacterium]